MVPLGAMWGDDPGVNSPITPPYPKLQESVINAKAPVYSRETLGWGGRLSGPNDGAVTQVAKNVDTKTVYKNLALSSCMSCIALHRIILTPSCCRSIPFVGYIRCLYTGGAKMEFMVQG